MRSRRKRVSLLTFLLATSIFTVFSLLTLRSSLIDPPPLPVNGGGRDFTSTTVDDGVVENEDNPFAPEANVDKNKSSCATVEEMGKEFENEDWKQSLRIRKLIQAHFRINGADRIRNLPAKDFCNHGFVLGKSSEAGFGNEMYKVLTGAALSIIKRYPFEEYITYSNISFTLNEVKHLWRQHECLTKYERQLAIRVDDFEKPSHTHVLCSDWSKWKEPIIWFQNTTDAVGAQFFLKNIHPTMRMAASELFGSTKSLSSRPNTFGELMKILISPSKDVEEAINGVLAGGADPDISVHMRMLMNRSLRVNQAVMNCLRKAVSRLPQKSRPKVFLLSDTPNLIKGLSPNISEFAEVVHFDYQAFRGNVQKSNRLQSLEFRAKDWGPAPRWVAFVDFFLAARARHGVVSGAHKRVGTTYAQLVAALAAANSLDENTTAKSFAFLCSFQSNLLTDGLRMQVGWGHVWNRFAGPMSCHNQSNQCAYTPLLPPSWWDTRWQTPIPRDIRRLAGYGVFLSDSGEIDEPELRTFCSNKKTSYKSVVLI
ncbi:hypothetical protein ACFE04_005031 [Oxalis oulophora]